MKQKNNKNMQLFSSALCYTFIFLKQCTTTNFSKLSSFKLMHLSYCTSLEHRKWSFCVSRSDRCLLKRKNLGKSDSVHNFIGRMGVRNSSVTVHRCGSSGSMRACRSAGPGSIPDRDKFPGWGFFSGFFLTCKTNVQEALGPKVPEYHLAIIIIHNRSLRTPMTWDVDAP